MKTKFLVLLTTSLLTIPGVAQEANPGPPPPDSAPQQSNGGGWRRVGDGSQARDEYGQSRQANAGAPMMGTPAPSQLTIPAGTWIKIRVDQPLSSDHNNPGEMFAATLSQPIVVDGFVVARRGQTVEGRVSDAVKAGKAKGTSRLGLELIQVGLVDGRQMPLRTQLMEYQGGTSVGRDIAAAGAVTGTGAAIGAMAGGGMGAAIGAAVGATASGIGILATRGRATEIHPESEVTFRTMEPIVINTDRASQAFMPVRQEDYEQRLQQRPPSMVVRNAPAYPYYGGVYGGYYGSYWGPGWAGYSPFWGPSFYFYSGPRYYGGYRGGYHGGHHGHR